MKTLRNPLPGFPYAAPEFGPESDKTTESLFSNAILWEILNLIKIPQKTSGNRPKPSVCYTRHPFHPLKIPSGAILRWDDDFHWNHENHKISWNSSEKSTFPLSEHAQKHCEFASQIDARRISRKLPRILSFYARSREFVAESPLFCLPDEHPFSFRNFIEIHSFQEMAEFPDSELCF